jgi:lambda family phage portal protein
MKQPKKQPLLDRIISYFSPSAGAKRLFAREQSKLLATRAYDAAQSFSASPIKRNSRSANQENVNAIAPIRENARDLLRNAPFASKGLSTIVNGVVGWGIEPQISHPDKNKQTQVENLWKEWSQGLCSIDGKTDFAGLQSQVMTAVVADGESIVREVILDNSVRLQVLEADYINNSVNGLTSKNGDFRNVSGLTIDRYNRPTHFHLYKQHPGDTASATEAVPANEVIHVYRQDRPGQLRGISWFAPVAHPLKMLAELQWTQLVRLKLSAAITGVITEEQSQLSTTQLQTQRASEMELTPGTFKYLNPGEKIEFPTIPNPEGFDGTTRLCLREVSSGLGITYESLSGDLSMVNFSSGRMGDLQFRANVDSWRWHMLVPRFLNPAFDRFKKFCALRGVDASLCVVSWTPPARQMISPVDEVSSTTSAIRAGLQTLPGAIRELGFNPETHLKEIAASNKMIDDLGIILDSDPRRTANQQLQAIANMPNAQTTQTKP